MDSFIQWVWPYAEQCWGPRDLKPLVWNKDRARPSQSPMVRASAKEMRPGRLIEWQIRSQDFRLPKT